MATESQAPEAAKAAAESQNTAATFIAAATRGSAESRAGVAKALRSVVIQRERERRRELDGIMASWPEGLRKKDAAQQVSAWGMLLCSADAPLST